MKFYENRKFIAPIVVFVASMLVVVADEVFPGLGLNVAVLQDWLWKVAGLIVFGDIGYDWITQALRGAKGAEG